MAAVATAVAAGLRVRAGEFAVQMLISSLPLRRESLRSSLSSLKTTLSAPASSCSSPRAVIYNCYPRKRNRLYWHTTTPFCTGARDAGATVSSDESESKIENKEEENVKETAKQLEIRVGKVLKAWRHEEADSLYVEEVDIGEAEPRIICSGLVKYVPLDLLQDASVVVLANLKPRNMRGVKSYGMLLAASDTAHENVELLIPPEGSAPGDRVWFGTDEDLKQLTTPATPNQIQKKKVWEAVQPHLRTDSSGTAMLGDYLMRTSSGVVTSKALTNANIS